MQNCKVCITYNSGAGVDAAVAGVPVITGNAGSFAWDVASHSLDTVDTPYCPDRTQWLNNLAYAEWSLDEIAAGLPWRHLKPRILDIL